MEGIWRPTLCVAPSAVGRRNHRRKSYGDVPWASARQGWADAPAADVKIMETHPMQS